MQWSARLSSLYPAFLPMWVMAAGSGTAKAGHRRLWVINGLPRSGQQQLAKLMVRSRQAIANELPLTTSSGWPAEGEKAWGRTREDTLAASLAVGQTVLFVRAPLFTQAAFAAFAPCYHVHVVRDPRQLFVALSRQPDRPALVQLARLIRNNCDLPEVRPLRRADIPGLDVLAESDDVTLLEKLKGAAPWRLYGAFYYFWILALLRNLQHGAICIELRTLTRSQAARSDMQRFFSAFGLTVNFDQSRIDQYATGEAFLDLGLPRIAWGAPLSGRTGNESRIAEIEARVGLVLEKAASGLALFVAEDVAESLTMFLDPAYRMLILPFLRPWFVDRRLGRQRKADNHNGSARR